MQDIIHRRVYHRPELVRLYAGRTDVLPAESTVLVRYRDDIVGRAVLDLGCGAGRLAAHLQLLTRSYLGIDISPDMIDHCRDRFPELRFAEGDMRWLEGIGAQTFAVVLAVATLIDSVEHEDRLRVLGEVRRVLQQGGLFVFSSHNRNWMNAGAPPRLERSPHPLVQLRHGFEYVIHRYRHAVMRRFEQTAIDHAVLSDPGRGFALLHYYIDREAQRRQLESAGFTLLEVLDDNGRPLAAGDSDRESSSLTYVARRD